jgi:hypothetical protein
MEKKMAIGVKLCGNCNPQIPSAHILLQIKERAESVLPEAKFEKWDAGGLAMLLVISGCAVDCATRPQLCIPEISVAGESVNLIPCSKENIGERVVQILNNILQGGMQ